MSVRIVYPFPLRPDFLARLELPDDLMEAEAERLAAFVRSVWVEHEDVGFKAAP